jgi:hypothetical protein
MKGDGRKDICVCACFVGCNDFSYTVYEKKEWLREWLQIGIFAH